MEELAWSRSYYFSKDKNVSFTLLRRHTLRRTELGKQIRIDLAWIQQEAGISNPFLECTQDKIDYVQDGWSSGTRRSLQLAHAEIKFLGIIKTSDLSTW